MRRLYHGKVSLSRVKKSAVALLPRGSPSIGLRAFSRSCRAPALRDYASAAGVRHDKITIAVTVPNHSIPRRMTPLRRYTQEIVQCFVAVPVFGRFPSVTMSPFPVLSRNAAQDFSVALNCLIRRSKYPPLKVGALRSPKGRDYRRGAKAPISTRLPHTSKPSFYFFRFDFSHCSNGS